MPDTINLSPSTPDSALIVGERFSLTGDSVTFTPVDTLAILFYLLLVSELYLHIMFQ